MFTLSLYQIISLLGVPSLASIITWIYTINKKNKKETRALKLGIQALLRSQMISDYNKWDERKYAPIYARENFENCWLQYEALGENGVMEDIHDKFMALPTSKPHK